MAGDDVNIRVIATTAQAQRAFRDLRGEVSHLKGTLIPLAAAAAPLAAALTPIAVKAAGAGTAVAAFGVAVAGQVGALSDAADAQDKYTDAVTKYGRGSKQAAEAQRLWSNQLSTMPQATARASVAMSTLKDTFKGWSDDMSAFTMTPVEKSFTVLGQLIPRLTPMVKGASSELDRLVTVAGGAVASPGFDAFSDRLSTFANESLKDAVDGVIHFARALSEGDADGPIRTFMEFAEANGPALRETLRNVGDAVMTLVEASAEAGPGMLTLVNAGLKLVAALPPELVATVMQLAVGLKLVTLAGSGAAAASAGIAMLGARIAALRAASAAAGGGMAGLAAAFGTLSTAAKATMIASGIGILLVALSALSEMGKKAPPDVEKLTTSLRTLGDTGRVTGEAARSFGKDLSGFADSLQKVTDPKGLDQVQQSIVSFFGTDSTPVKEAKENIDAVDKALANLVKNGQAELAADALNTLTEKLKDQGFSAKEIRGQMDDYKAALADAAFEQQLAVESMGIFGAAAQDTSAKLAAQKGAADGLRASILALNDVNRSAYDAQIQFEGAIDDLTASFKEHGSTLDLDTEAGRANATAMSQAAKSQDELIASGLAAGESLGSMTKKSDQLRTTMLKLATEAFDGNKQKAREYVDTLLGTPESIKTLVELERKDAISGLQDVQTALQATPDAKSITVDTLSGAAIAALEAVGLKTKQLPDGRTQVFTKNGSALGSIDAVRRAMNNLNGKKATTWTYHNVQTRYSVIGSIPKGQSLQSVVGGYRRAGGGLAPGYADGGQVVQTHPTGGLITGPGTGTSDSILELSPNGGAYRTSDREYIVQAAAVRKYGVGFLDALNAGRLKLAGFARGGMSQTMRDAQASLRSQFGISYFGRMAGYRRTPFERGLGAPTDVHALVSALNKASGDIKRATGGRTESRLLRQLSSVGRTLISYDKQLGRVNSSLEKARDRLNSLRDAASQLRDSIRNTIVSGADITRAANANDSRVTINTLLSQARGDTANATEFAAALAVLKKRGLSGNVLEQVASAGVSGGGLETAQALLGASSAQLKELGDLNHNLRVAANAAGVTGSDALYGPSIKAQSVYVSTLTKQQDKLEKAMVRLATVMEKSIGRVVGRKAAGGIAGGATWVGEQGPELLDLPAGARVWSNPDSRRMAAAPWASMLTTRRGRASAAQQVPMAADGGRPIVLHVSLAGQQFGQIWVDVGRREVRTRGGLSATLGS